VKTVIHGTNIEASRLGFGTSSLHHLFSKKDRRSLLLHAESRGITHFDTSPYYGYGLAESDIGMTLSAMRSTITITTKFGLYPYGPSSNRVTSVLLRKILGKIVPRVGLPAVNWSVNRAESSLNESLRRLSSDYVDFLFLHEPDPRLLHADECLTWLQREQQRGRIRAWGIAGLRTCALPWVRSGHALASVVQTQDSLDRRQADFLTESGRKLQFTYGYLSGGGSGRVEVSPEETIRRALRRNADGCVLVSTRRVSHLRRLASAIS